MALPSGTTISADQINIQLGRAGATTMDIGGTAERNIARVLSGQISYSDFWGKPTSITGFYFRSPNWPTTSGTFTLEVQISGGTPNSTVNISCPSQSSAQFNWTGFNTTVTLNSAGAYTGNHGTGNKSGLVGSLSFTVSWSLPAIYGGYSGNLTRNISNTS